MPSYKRPGVYVEESLNLSATLTATATGIAAFAASHGRGPTTPTLITSWSQFQNIYGGFSEGDDLAYAVFQFLSNGGRAAWVLRVSGANTAVAGRTFQDRNATPANTLRVDAIDAGNWGNAVYVEVTDSGTNRFNLTVYSGGNSSSNIVERWTDLSMDENDARYVERIINGINGGSSYIAVTDLDSGTAAPGDRPGVGAPVVLAGGADGDAVTAGNVGSALAAFDVVNTSFVLNLPNVTDSTAINQAIAYAAGRGDVFVIVDPPEGDTPSEVITFSDALTASSYAALYYPRVWISDPKVTSSGATKLVPPGAAMAGRFAEVDATRGVFRAPAGISTRIANAVSLETNLSDANLDDLAAAHVNALRLRPGAGISAFGARTLEPSLSSKFIPVRRTLMYLRRTLLDSLDFALFEPNDQLLWSQIQTVIAQFLGEFWRAGGLKGNAPEEAFYVKCDADNNTPQTVDRGEVHVEVGVALQKPAEFIVIKVGQWEGGQSVVEIQ